MAITKEMIQRGLENGTVSIIDADGDYGCIGVCCKIADNAFYFLDAPDCNDSLEQYHKKYSMEDTVEQLFSVLKDKIAAASHGIWEEEWDYYSCVLDSCKDSTDTEIDVSHCFTAGCTYHSHCWFTGGTFSYICVRRNESEVTFKPTYFELDGVHEIEEETFPVFVKDGREYVVVQSYKGNENRMFAER